MREVRRSRLIRFLDAIPRGSLVTLSAPQGFGKRRLLRQYEEYCAAKGRDAHLAVLDADSLSRGQLVERIRDLLAGSDTRIVAISQSSSLAVLPAFGGRRVALTRTHLALTDAEAAEVAERYG